MRLTVQDVLEKANVRPNRSGKFTCPDPAHEDEHPSANIYKSANRNDRVKCQSCGGNWGPLDLAEFYGIRSDDFKPQESEVYRYTDEDGRLLYEQVRYIPKDFRVRIPQEDGGYVYKLNGVRRVPYRLPEVRSAIEDGKLIIVTEGERDADALSAAGLVATTNPFGAGKWSDEYSECLRGASGVVVIADADDVGRAHAQQVAESVHKVAPVKVIELPSAKDASDWLEQGGTIQELGSLLEHTPHFDPDLSVEEPPTVVATPSQDPPKVLKAEWPTLGDAAYYGLIGEIARTNEPHSESDPAGVLVSLLVGFGAMVGQEPHVGISSTQHPPRLFALLVGDTAKGRKGMAWSDARRFLSAADSDWIKAHVLNGLSSGEGLIYATRDGSIKDEDEGGIKEVLINEAEFSSVLVHGKREGNVLSDVLRQVWDGGTLRTLTKKNPITATDPHIGMLGHITPDDAQARLSSVQVLNGFGNRFMYCLVRKSKDLPFGGDLPDHVVQDLGERLRNARDKARSIRRVGWTEPAKGRWEKVYMETANKARYGLLGAVVGRAQPQMLRLALTYALLDGKDKIDVPHLEAAFALWDYCERSAYWIFGSVSGNETRDRLLEAISEAGPKGLTFTQQHNVFGGHAKKSDIERERRYLEAEDVVVTVTRPSHGTRGQGRNTNVTVLAQYAGEKSESAKEDDGFPRL